MRMRSKFEVTGLPHLACRQLLLILGTLVSLMMFPTWVVAQVEDTSSSNGGQLDIKILGDRILARVEIMTEVWYKDTHVIIDYESPEALMVNGNVLGGIAFGEGETTLKILSEDFRLEVPISDIRPEQGSATSDITARYDNELKQIDVIAIVGWPALRPHGITLDIQDKTFVMHREGELTAADLQMSADVFVEGVEVIGSSVFVPVNYNGGQRAFMKMSTSGYHTVLNRELLDDRERGIVDEAFFGADESVKISDMAAFYPQDLYMQWWDAYAAAKESERNMRQQMQEAGQTFPEEFAVRPPDQPSSDVLFVSGLSVLSGYRIVLHPIQGFAGFTRTINNNYSDADYQFYMAAAAKDEESLYQYLEANPTDRNVEEAVADLFALGLESGATVERQLATVDFGLDVHQERRRFGYVTSFLFPLLQTDESRDQFADLIIGLGEKSLPFASTSETPALRQQIQMIVGDRYLARNDARNAQRFFLSAAYNGDPRFEAAVTFDLARAYEALGQDRRAFATYQRAISRGLAPNQNQSATEALSRIRTRLDPNDELLRESQEQNDG